MPRPGSLTRLEGLVLAAILSLREQAYGVTIHARAREMDGRGGLAPGPIYFTLDRLEDRGMVASWLSDPTAERGERAKRCYRVEALGEQALRESEDTARRIQEGIVEAWGKDWVRQWGKRWGKEAG